MLKMNCFRNFQLAVLGWVSILIAPLVWLSSFINGFPFPQSISETGTMPSVLVSFILPFCLGALALFSLSYALRYSYNFIWDKVFTICMCVGFTLVAAFPTYSLYVIADHMIVTPRVSHIIHIVGALLGFGAAVGWVFCFTKSDKPKPQQTPQKHLRNKIYKVMGVGIIICLTVLLLSLTGQLHVDFALVYWLEAVILSAIGICCLVKAGVFFKDKTGGKSYG